MTPWELISTMTPWELISTGYPVQTGYPVGSTRFTDSLARASLARAGTGETGNGPVGCLSLYFGTFPEYKMMLHAPAA